MAAAPTLAAEGALRLTVTSGGQALPATVQVHACTVSRAFNAIPWARVVLQDGEMAGGNFAVSDEGLFAPGAILKISACYGKQPVQLFEGIVLRHGLTLSGRNAARLVVECRDPAAVMTVRRHNANHVDKTDSEVLQDLVAAHQLKAQIEATTTRYRELVQYDCTDWDFLVARAEFSGLLVAVKDGLVKAGAPQVAAAPALKVAWGKDLHDFQADMDARNQMPSCQAVAWNPKTQAVVRGSQAQAPDLNKQGNLASAALAKVVGREGVTLRSHTPQDPGVLDGWARAAQLKAGLARICGRMTIQGSAKVELGSLIELAGVGKRFSGVVFVSAFQHEFQDGVWTTRVDFGLKPGWQVERPDVVGPANGGHLPGVGGLLIGVVKQLEEDPAGEHRIQVEVPVMQAQVAGVWARLVQGHASSGFGAFFLPEVGDEVVLGYFHDDPCHPVILGSLYSSSRKPPYALAEANDTKAFVTRCKHRFEFDEKNKKITLTTPGLNQVVLDDSDHSILVQDEHGNFAKLSSDGIHLDSPKDIKLVAKGDISLEATKGITLKAKADLQAEALNVTLEGKTALEAKGSSTATFSSSGQTTVKGSMVMIN